MGQAGETGGQEARDKAVAVVPVAAAERIAALDLMRGIAVLGILLANITGFAHGTLAYYWPPALPGGDTAADRWIWLAQFVAVDGKFRGLFTLLFGVGLALLWSRAERAGHHALALQLRRLVLLGLIGLAHFYLLYVGDILFSYACAGLIALLFRRLSAERLMAIGLIWLALGAGIQTMVYLAPALGEIGNRQLGAEILAHYREYWQQQLAEAEAAARVLASGSFADVVAYRFRHESHLVPGYASFALFETVPLMLLGMGFCRYGLFAGNERAPPGRQTWAWLCLAAGLVLNLGIGLWVMVHGFSPYLTQLAFFGLSNIANIPLLLGGFVLLARWAMRDHAGWLAERLVLAGRMALTNYVGTSLVMVLLFQGWAGGLFGTLHRAELLLVVLLGWALMLTFSRLWLARYRQGPLEWLWRCATYGRLFANRLS